MGLIIMFSLMGLFVFIMGIWGDDIFDYFMKEKKDDSEK